MTTLYDALAEAKAYWDAKGPSSRMMPIRANACATALGPNMARKLKVADLRPEHATRILTSLHRNKGKGSVPVYYAAFKRAVEMAGGDTRGWPKAGSAPRKCREPLSEADMTALAYKLRGYAYADDTGKLARTVGWETYDLLELLRGTGLRVEREALNGDALRWDPDKRILHVTGKGDHQRRLPVERPETVALLNDTERMSAMRNLSYSGHLKRWNLAIDRLKVTSLKPTPHAVRHYYATKVYQASGCNLRLVQELLGHSDIATTAGYLGVDVEQGREFVR